MLFGLSGQLLLSAVIMNECLVMTFQPEAGHYEVDRAAGTLRIVSVARADKGNYACVVNTTGHPVVVSGNAHLYVESTLSVLPRLSCWTILISYRSHKQISRPL